MNDFTKDELKRLLGILTDRMATELTYYNIDIKLEPKIQSLIDNYCEHSQHFYYGDIPVGECTECHMVMIP